MAHLLRSPGRKQHLRLPTFLALHVVCHLRRELTPAHYAQQLYDTLRPGTKLQHNKYQASFDKYWKCLFPCETFQPVHGGAKFWAKMNEGHKLALERGGQEGQQLQEGKAHKCIFWPRILVRSCDIHAEANLASD